MNIVRTVTWPINRWMESKAMGRNSLEIDSNQGLANMQGASLMAWMNYHHRDIHGKQCTWMGVTALKNPLDAWIYQEILYEVKPDIILELGNNEGGGTLFLANMCDLLGHGQVIGVDINHEVFKASHPRIELITGDTTSDEVIEQVRAKCEGKRVLIIHDAAHTKEIVLRDLRNYSPLVAVGSYLIVEDTSIGIPGFKDGPFFIPRQNTPLQSIDEFINENPNFVIDESRERYILTENYRGFLRRVA